MLDVGERMTMDVHSHALLLIMPFNNSGMRNKGVGSRWTSKPLLQAKMQAKLKSINRIIVEILQFEAYLSHPWALSEH